MHDLVETSELVAFTKIVEAKSLSRAAAELGVPRATLGRRLSRLEGRLGARLLRRTTRSLALTDAGETFYRQARIVLGAVKTAEASVRRAGDEVAGDLRISVPPVADENFFALLTAFAKAHPHVRLHVHFSSRYVDLRRDGYDMALRAGSDFEPGLVARTLARSKLVAVASPAYLSERGTPTRRKDLKGHRCLVGFARGELPETHWPAAGGPVRVEGAFFSNGVGLLLAAALAGLGIAFLPLFMVKGSIESGALVQVLPGIVEGDNRVAIVYAEREFVPAHMRALVDAIAAWAVPGQSEGEDRCRQRQPSQQGLGGKAKAIARRAAARSLERCPRALW